MDSFSVINNVQYWYRSKVFNSFMENEIDYERLTEKEEAEEGVDEKVAILADWILHAQNCVFWTGAGISRSSGIPDYRGPDGLWTRYKQQQELPQPVDLLSVTPSFSHLAITKLIRGGYANFVVTVNVDGLHRKAGLKFPSELVNLHGCVFTERCTSCRIELERDYVVRKMKDIHDHRVGDCANCGSKPKQA